MEQQIKLGGIKFPKKSANLKKQLKDFNHDNHRIRPPNNFQTIPLPQEQAPPN